MCAIDRYTLVYPQEDRTYRDKFDLCPYSIDGQPCSRAYVRDRGEHYILPRSRSEGRYPQPSTYQIVEPSEYTKPAKKVEVSESSHRPKRRTVDLDSLRIRIPWGKRSEKRGSERQEGHTTRGRERAKYEPKPFIVDPPNRQENRPSSRSRPQDRPPIQEIRPRPSKHRETPSTPRGPPPRPPPGAPELSPSTSCPPRRAPRERTPVSDRIPHRSPKTSSPPKSPVVVHHHHEDESPPLTPTREHRRQRGPIISPQRETIRHVHRNRDLRHQAEEDSRNQPERERGHGYRAHRTDAEDSRQAAWDARDRRYARHCQEERPLRSFAERRYEEIGTRGRSRYGRPVILQEGTGGCQIHRGRERIYESEARKPARNRYGFPSGIFDRFRPRQVDPGPRDFFPRRSSVPYGQKIVLDDDFLRSGWRWR